MRSIEEVFPILFERADIAFPEFEFKRSGENWISGNTRKIDGEEGDKGKVYIYRDRPYYLKDWQRGGISIYKYVEQQNGTRGRDTIDKLCELAGVPAPEWSREQQEKYQERAVLAEIMEEANQFFIDSLLNEPEAKEAREYLERRKLPLSSDRTPGEIGYIPSKKKLLDRLFSLKFEKSHIEKFESNLSDSIGMSHKLTIPYRGPGGRVLGFKVRNINHKDGDGFPKYLNSRGLEVSDTLFNVVNIRKEKDAIVVEGELDCIALTERGLSNVVALAGRSFNRERVELAKRYGVECFSLCLDEDKAGEDGTLGAIQTLREAGVEDVYIISLPATNGKTDPDSYVRENGIEAFRDLFKKARSYSRYYADKTIEYIRAEENTDKRKDDILKRVVKENIEIHPAGRESYLKLVEPVLREVGIYAGAIEEKMKELLKVGENTRTETALNEIVRGVNDNLKAGDLSSAIKVLESGVKNIRIEESKKLVEPATDWKEQIKNTPPRMSTGFKKLDAFAKVQLGAITLIAGRPQHGKTALMANILLNMMNEHKEKSFYFFSYEEQAKNIYLRLLNIKIGNLNLLENLQKARRDIFVGAITNQDALRLYIQNREKFTDETIEKHIGELDFYADSGRLNIYDGAYTIESLASYVQGLRGNTGAIFIDYVQRIRISKKTQDKRVEVATISDLVLNDIAKPTGLPVILGSQLNRTAEDSYTLSTLKEAGNLEEDANLVLGIENDIVKARESGGDLSKESATLTITALKNREGRANQKDELYLILKTGRIED